MHIEDTHQYEEVYRSDLLEEVRHIHRFNGHFFQLNLGQPVATMISLFHLFLDYVCFLSGQVQTLKQVRK